MVDIFNAFVTTKAKGTGLGLAICRMIIERHGGQLTATSDGQSGALFQFVLPIKPGDMASLV
jgi:signal transduction histidine kinase